MRPGGPTIDGNSHSLVKSVAISADEGRDLGVLVRLEEIRARIRRVGLDLLELKTVGLCDREDCSGPRVLLARRTLEMW